MSDGMDYSDHTSSTTFDSDGDGYDDTVLADTNSDGIGDTQYTEYTDGSSLTLVDSTGDGVADFETTDYADGTSVTDVDVNGDGYSDGSETDFSDGSVYAQADSDGDGAIDTAVYYTGDTTVDGSGDTTGGDYTEDGGTDGTWTSDGTDGSTDGTTDGTTDGSAGDIPVDPSAGTITADYSVPGLTGDTGALVNSINTQMGAASTLYKDAIGEDVDPGDLASAEQLSSNVSGNLGWMEGQVASQEHWNDLMQEQQVREDSWNAQEEASDLANSADQSIWAAQDDVSASETERGV